MIVFISSGLLFNVCESVTVSAMNLSIANDFAATVLYDMPSAISVPGINLKFMNITDYYNKAYFRIIIFLNCFYTTHLKLKAIQQSSDVSTKSYVISTLCDLNELFFTSTCLNLLSSFIFKHVAV